MAGLNVPHPLSFSGSQNLQLVFSLRAQDGKVKKVQGYFLILYARIPEGDSVKSQSLGILTPPSLRPNPQLQFCLSSRTSQPAHQGYTPCLFLLFQNTTFWKYLGKVSPIETLGIANQAIGFWLMGKTLLTLKWDSWRDVLIFLPTQGSFCLELHCPACFTIPELWEVLWSQSRSYKFREYWDV